MTLQVRIKNDGNVETDQFVMRGVKVVAKDDEGRPTHIGAPGTETVYVRTGEEVIFYPPSGHFDDFAQIETKGKH